MTTFDTPAPTSDRPNVTCSGKGSVFGGGPFCVCSLCGHSGPHGEGHPSSCPNLRLGRDALGTPLEFFTAQLPYFPDSGVFFYPSTQVFPPPYYSPFRLHSNPLIPTTLSTNATD